MNQSLSTNRDLENPLPIISQSENENIDKDKNPIQEIRDGLDAYFSACLPPINKLINRLLPDKKNRDLTFYEKIDEAYSRIQNQKLVAIRRIQEEINSLEEKYQLKIDQSEASIEDLNNKLLKKKSKQNQNNNENMILQELILKKINKIDQKISENRQDEEFFKEEVSKPDKKLSKLSGKIDRINKKLKRKFEKKEKIENKLLNSFAHFVESHSHYWARLRRDHFDLLDSEDVYCDDNDIDEIIVYSLLMQTMDINVKSDYYRNSVKQLNQHKRNINQIKSIDKKKIRRGEVFVDHVALSRIMPKINIAKAVKSLAEAKLEARKFDGEMEKIISKQQNLVNEYEKLSKTNQEHEELLHVCREEISKLMQEKNNLISKHSQLKNYNSQEELNEVLRIKNHIATEQELLKKIQSDKKNDIQQRKDAIEDIRQNGDDLDSVLKDACEAIRKSNHDAVHPIYEKISKNDQIFNYFHLKINNVDFKENPHLNKLTHVQLANPKHGSPYGLSKFIPQKYVSEKKRIDLIEDLNKSLEKSISKNLILISWVKKNVDPKDPVREKLLKKIAINSRKMHALYENNFIYISRLGKKIIPGHLHKKAPLDQVGGGHLSEIITTAAIADEQYQRDQNSFTTYLLPSEFEGYCQDIGFALKDNTEEYYHMTFAQITTVSSYVPSYSPLDIFRQSNNTEESVSSRLVNKTERSWKNDTILVQTNRYNRLFEEYLNRRDYSWPSFMDKYIVRPLYQKLENGFGNNKSLPENIKFQVKVLLKHLAINEKHFQDYFNSEKINLNH